MTSHYDILIAGGSTGGTAAAIAAAEAGATVCLVAEYGQLGGQLTTQGVCTPDEHRYIETFGSTRRYAWFRSAVRDHYRALGLSPNAAEVEHLNPGSCWVSRVSFEPRVGAQILQERASALVASGALTILYRAQVASLGFEGDLLCSATVRMDDGSGTEITFRYLLDATDTGDLLPLCGEEGSDWVVGAESQATTGEPDAPKSAMRHWIQPFTFPFAIEWSPQTAQHNVISPPRDYERLKELQRYHVIHGAITGLFAGAMPWWRYRRVLAQANFAPGVVKNDLAMINTAGNDFYGGNILGGSPVPGEPDPEISLEVRERNLDAGRRAALGYLYWLQTECPREAADLAAAPSPPVPDLPEGTCGYPEFRLRTDLFGTVDGLPEQPYIRESRRILSQSIVREQDIVVNDFAGNPCRGESARAARMHDSVGVGHYALDIHPNGHGEPNHYVPTRPFQIPLGALDPRRIANLLAACKNLGVTHLANGAYRLHPIEWNVGESAGLLAAWCVANAVTPQQILADPILLERFQLTLLRQGIPLHWFVDVPQSDPAFVAVQWLACKVPQPGSDEDLLFRPEDALTIDDWETWTCCTGVEHLPFPAISDRRSAAVALFTAAITAPQTQ